MNQEAFVQSGAPRWQRYEEMLADIERKRGGGRGFPALYRAVCRDLAIARQRQLDAHLVDRLNSLVLRGHQQMYRTSSHLGRVLELCTRGLPRAVRAERRFVLAAALLFYGSAALLAGVVFAHPDIVHSVLDAEEVAMFEAMYDPASEHQLRPRGDETDTAMLGYYIMNNTGIGFRTFAGGIFLGLGTLLFLMVNGVMLGAVAGHIVHMGYTTPFTSFIIGHGALELQAIVLVGAAGLMLGWSLAAPGPHSRGDALKLSVLRALPLVYGGSGLFLLAACIEAYWSASRAVPPAVKYVVGGALWLAILLYFLLPGRDAAPTPASAAGAALSNKTGRPAAPPALLPAATEGAR